MNKLVCAIYCVLAWLWQVFSLLLTPRADGNVWNTVKKQGRWCDRAAAICSIRKHIRPDVCWPCELCNIWVGFQLVTTATFLGGGGIL